MLMVQDWKECWRHALGGTSVSLMILFLLGPNLWVLWWERPASLDRRTRPWLGFFLMLVVLAPPLFIYFVSGKFKISSYVEVCVPFKSSSLHQCSRPFWKLRQLLWGFCLLWVVNPVEWTMLWCWPWESYSEDSVLSVFTRIHLTFLTLSDYGVKELQSPHPWLSFTFCGFLKTALDPLLS